MSALTVLSCGPMTSLQDTGRVGFMRLGVSRSGAMDPFALAEANTLAGNPPGTAAIEFTLLGGSFAPAGGAVRLGLAGGSMRLVVDGHAVPPGTSAVAGTGVRVTVDPGKAGVFSYLAVAGGFDLPPQFGSLSLHLRSGIGGFEGRALRAGDVLPLREASDTVDESVSLPLRGLDPDAPIRVVLGPQDDHFEEAEIAAFLFNRYTVSPEADRMGFRLAGAAVRHRSGYNIVSDGIVPGSVQVPGSGLPIVMMADHQTTGGYPKIATVISADLGVLAQRRPGQGVRFAAVSVEEAQGAAREQAEAAAALPSRLRPARPEPRSELDLMAANLAGDATDALRPDGD